GFVACGAKEWQNPAGDPDGLGGVRNPGPARWRPGTWGLLRPLGGVRAAGVGGPGRRRRRADEPRDPGGVALRLARVPHYRPDQRAGDADTNAPSAPSTTVSASVGPDPDGRPSGLQRPGRAGRPR